MKVVFVNRILAHYRRDVLAILDADPRFDCIFVAGEDKSGVATIPDGHLREVRKVRNVFVTRFTWQIGVLRSLLNERPSLVVCEGDFGILSNWLLALVARARGVKVVFWTIGWRHVDPVGLRHVRLAFYRLAHHLLLYGHRGRELGIASGYPVRKMSVVGNSVSQAMVGTDGDPPELWARIAALEAEDLPVVVAVARVTALKRFDLLLRSARIARDAGSPFAIAIVGDGPELNYLHDLALSLDVRLHLLGPAYSDEALRSIYRLARVSVLPKAAGLTTIQSLRHGIPVITDDDHAKQVPEADAIIPGVTGDRYRRGDLVHLERVIRRWIEDPDRERVGRACRAEVERRWTAAGHAARIAEVLEGAVANRRIPL